jgi:hypothetical protein
MRITLIFCLLLLTFTLAHAQESTPEPTDGWTIEQRCVTEPTTPPDDWFFDGTILMTGYQGIHAVNANFETPFVIAPWGIAGGALSPDGRWYAMPNGDVHRNNNMIDYSMSIDEIIVYRTTPQPESYTIAWDLLNVTIDPINLPLYITWLDNEHFVFYTGNSWRTIDPVLANPFTGEIQSWDYPLILDHAAISPDTTRLVVDGGLYDFASVEQIQSVRLSAVRWANDSSFFIGVNRSQIVQVDRDGAVRTLVQFPTDQNLYPYSPHRLKNTSISADMRYIAYADYSELQSHLYIIDLQEQRLFDTCLDIRDGVEWSPSGHQLVLLGLGDEQNPVNVLDVDSWSLYTVAYHTVSYYGGIIGWRADN